MGKNFLFIMPFLALLSFLSCEEEDSVTLKTENTINGHEYVDLSLPSGTLWATCNVGATKPWEYGAYFAWGETKSKIGSYDDFSYKWSSFDSHNNYNGASKYKPNSFGDQTYDYKVLLSEDDAATVNWGAEWRMPTKDEFVELKKNCQESWEAINNVLGIKFTGKNGKWIFLPAAGSHFLDKIIKSGTVGLYWSSSIYDQHAAYPLEFDSTESVSFADHYRFQGCTVRPVHENTQNKMME